MKTAYDRYKQFFYNPNRERLRVSTGIRVLDTLISGTTNGLESGKIYHIAGRPSSGKTTLALSMAAAFQRTHQKPVLWVDLERSYIESYAVACGVDPRHILVALPDSAETALNIIEDFIREGIQFVVLDSVAQLVPQSQQQKKFGDSIRVAETSGLITLFCRRAIPLLDAYDATLVALNQMRKNFNTMSPEEEIPFGAMALFHAANVTLHLKVVKTEADRITVRATTKKNKQGAPQKSMDLLIRYGYGVDEALTTTMMASQMGIFTQSGSWYTYNDARAQGIDNAARQFFSDRLIQDVQNRLLANDEGVK